MKLFVVVTGASRGIGYRLTEAFAAAGDAVVLAIARNTILLAPLISKYPSHIIPVEYDLTSVLQDENELNDIIRQHTNKIDILINNAGSLLNQPFETSTAKDIRNLFDINYMVPALLVRSLIPLLKMRGHVVNIVSMGGFQGSVKFNGLSHYSASKAALAVLTECLAAEYQDICFNALALGAVQTEMLQKAFPGYQAPIDATQAADFISGFARNGHHYFNGKILPVSLSTP